jgi:predicted SAM-dependent methyltransferase
MRVVNLGCGPYKLRGAINLDRNAVWEPEIVRDLRRGLPFDESSVDELHASHILEHLAIDDMVFVVAEAWRVLKPGAPFRITVPLHDHTSLDHLHVLDEHSLDEFLRPEQCAYYGAQWSWMERVHRIEQGRYCKHLFLEWVAVK